MSSAVLASPWRRRLLTALPIALATGWLAYQALHGVLVRLGHPGATLDDSFIHFQYARAIAEGHPFRYQAGEPPTSGATSLLWPMLLAPFYALGFRDLSILWPAWGLSFLALGFLAHETFLLARGLVGTACAIGAGALVLSLGAFTWFAASGMEVVPFAFSCTRAMRRSSEWAESPPARAPSALKLELVLLAFLAPLLRPEGAVASLMIAATLLVFRPGSSRRDYLPGLLAFAAPLTPMLLSLWLTGSLFSSTAKVKLLFGNPYYPGSLLGTEVEKNLRVLVGTLFDGEAWSAEFVPRGSAVLLVAGLLSIPIRGAQAGRRWRSLSILVLALTICAPCAYVSFLWNRLRYLWPFAPGWLVGLACLARLLGDGLGKIRPGWRAAAPLACGAFAGSLLMYKDFAIGDVADSASGIDRQQVTLGRWAKENLPPSARIGVNDTGAIAYLSERRTFDIVGLTTRDEGRYWVAGPASRFEHYEKLYAENPRSLPTHFIVYPEWMACDAVLGRALYEATVLDATILGGRTMRVYEADYSLLGSGEKPWTPGLLVFDSLDVGDLESEASHHYELMGAKDGEQVVIVAAAPDEHLVADGGRLNRVLERFVVDAPSDPPSVGTVRVASVAPTHVRVFANDAEVGSFEIDEAHWAEYSFPIKPGHQTVELRAESGIIGVYHYWFSRAPVL
jgi:hypothetical protein